jgi:serine/threonine protein kinase
VNFGNWEVVGEPIGRGGQGTVFKVRTPKRGAELGQARLKLMEAFRELSARNWEVALNNFEASMSGLTRSDDPAADLAALKQFDINADGSPEAQSAIRRFEREVEALQSIQHPGILKLIEANVTERWFVTEFHPRGTLAKAGSLYKGDAISALTAFRSIVEAVAGLHTKGYVHRDIKSPNVFLATDDRLVLGDFGIVFYEDEQHTRLTETFERVGSRDWMAPWAHTGKRIDDVKPTFDVFSLGKLLWVMVSGTPILPPYYTHRNDGFDLETIFPGEAGMEQINSILDKCVVVDEKQCFETAEPLLVEVESALKSVRARVFDDIKQLRERVTGIANALDSLEKRMLLRQPGNLNCRLCNAHLTELDAGRLDPPLSEFERQFHQANHGLPQAPDWTRGLPGFSAGTNWTELEKQVEAFNKARR